MKASAWANTIQWADGNWFPARYGFCPSEKAWNRFMRSHGIPCRPYPVSPDCAGCCSIVDTPSGSYCLVTVDEQR